MLICTLDPSLCFTPYFRTQHFYQNRHFKSKASVALNPLVSLLAVSLRVAAENVVTDRQTDGRTDGMRMLSIVGRA